MGWDKPVAQTEVELGATNTPGCVEDLIIRRHHRHPVAKRLAVGMLHGEVGGELCHVMNNGRPGNMNCYYSHGVDNKVRVAAMG